MIDYLDAPMPYIIGIQRDVWNKIKGKKQKVLTSDVAIYDIDQKKLIHNESLPEIPNYLLIDVYNTMKRIITEGKRKDFVLLLIIIGTILD